MYQSPITISVSLFSKSGSRIKDRTNSFVSQQNQIVHLIIRTMNFMKNSALNLKLYDLLIEEVVLNGSSVVLNFRTTATDTFFIQKSSIKN